MLERQKMLKYCLALNLILPWWKPEQFEQRERDYIFHRAERGSLKEGKRYLGFAGGQEGYRCVRIGGIE